LLFHHFDIQLLYIVNQIYDNYNIRNPWIASFLAMTDSETIKNHDYNSSRCRTKKTSWRVYKKS